MESFITFFTQFLGKHLSKEGVIFLISVFPVLELRGGLIAASLLKVPFLKGLLISLIGNVLPIPFVLLFFSKIVTLLEKFSYTKPLAGWFREKVDKNKKNIEKYDFWGLAQNESKKIYSCHIPRHSTGQFDYVRLKLRNFGKCGGLSL